MKSLEARVEKDEHQLDRECYCAGEETINQAT
jgi:hypothetical protein